MKLSSASCSSRCRRTSSSPSLYWESAPGQAPSFADRSFFIVSSAGVASETSGNSYCPASISISMRARSTSRSAACRFATGEESASAWLKKAARRTSRRMSLSVIARDPTVMAIRSITSARPATAINISRSQTPWADRRGGGVSLPSSSARSVLAKPSIRTSAPRKSETETG